LEISLLTAVLENLDLNVKRRVKDGDKFARCLIIITIKENGKKHRTLVFGWGINLW